MSFQNFTPEFKILMNENMQKYPLLFIRIYYTSKSKSVLGPETGVSVIAQRQFLHLKMYWSETA